MMSGNQQANEAAYAQLMSQRQAPGANGGGMQPTGAPTMGINGGPISPMNTQQTYMDPAMSSYLAQGSINELTGQRVQPGIMPGVGTGPGWTPEGGGDLAGTYAQAPGANGGGMHPLPAQNLQIDPAYLQQVLTMKSSQPRINGVRSNGGLLSPGQFGVNPGYAGQPTLPAMTSRPAPIGRIRGR